MRYQFLSFVICSVLINVDSILIGNATQPCETPQYVQLGAKGIVHCNFTDDYFGVYWYNSTDYVNEFSLINIKNSENPKNGPGFETGEFDVYHNGSLIIQKVNFGHAHTYTVVKLDSPTDVIIPHYVDVLVTALPTPPYPVIEGCNSQQACVMEVGNQGNLTCSVKGIVPHVDLEWRGVQEDSSVVFIRSERNTTRRADGRYNVFLTSSFYINRIRGHSSNVECRVTVHKKGPKFDLRSSVVMIFTDETTQQPAPTKGTKATSAAVVVIPVVVVVLVVVVAIVTYLLMKGRTNSRESNKEMGLARTTEKGSEDSESEQEPLLDMSEVAPFTKLLKEKYREVFGSIIVVSTSHHKCEPQKIPNSTETEGEIHTEPTGYVEDTTSGNCSTAEKGTGNDSISIEQENFKTMEEENKNDARTSCAEVEAEKPKTSHTEASSAVNVSATTFSDQEYFAENRFVLEPTIQVLTSKPGSGTQGIWKNCTSISETLTDSNIESKSFIVEGDFGHEISNISKLLAREWSMEETSSLASHFDVLIVLKLNQVRGDKTVSSEIRRLLLSSDTLLTDDHIQKVLQKHEKVAFVLDGFNTYVDCECSSNCEVTQIIRREFLTKCTVILTTSHSCVPNDFKQKFTRLRVKGLSPSDQDFLISREVALKADTKSEDKIKCLVKESFILREILQIPLFFDMFLKMTSQMTNVPKLESITLFFLRIMSGLYMNSPKPKTHDVALWDAELGNVAFEALKSKRGKDKCWSKGEICKNLGEDTYNFYHQMGVLKEEEVPHWDTKSLQSKSTIVAFDTSVTFAHPLFCEWYAAHHLLTTMKTDERKYEEGELIILLSYNCWYCIRFLCGIINDEISRKICKVVEPKVLQILCQLETQGTLQNITEAVRSWCSQEVVIEPEHTKAQQMATVQLLEFGSQREVSHLTLKNCFNSVEGSSEFLELRSGVQLPVLKNMKRLDVIEEGRELTNNEVTGILNFALLCSKLEAVKFFQCILPQTLEGINTAANSKFKGVKVEWTPDTESSHAYHLGRTKFTWKRQNGEELGDFMYRGLVEEFRDKHGIQTQD